MAAVDDARIMSGHRAVIKIEGEVVGFAQGITWQTDFGVQDALVLGSYTVAEHQGTVFRVNGSIQQFRIRKQVQEILAKRSSEAVSKQGLFDLEVQDDTGEHIAYIVGVTLGGKSGGVQAGQLSTEATTFRALDIRSLGDL